MGGPRAWVGEFIGTLLFVTIGAGSVIATNTNIAPLGVFGVAAAHGLAFSVAVTAFSGISGGHLNPAVTLSLWVGGRIRHADAVAYVTAQVAGAVAAGAVLVAMFGSLADRVNLGTPGPRAGLATWRVLLIEAVFTLFVLVAVWTTMTDEGGPRIGGFAVGLMVFAGMLVTAQLTGGVMNPARHLGPALIAGSLGNWWLYWLGPAIGAVVAGLVFPIVLLDRRFPWRLVPATEATEPVESDKPPARKITRGR